MDGTFSLAPRQFQQLYVIRVPVGTTYASCVYALMSGKSQDEYEELLRAVLAGCGQYGYDADPDVVITDFEQSVIRAVTAVLGSHVVHRGCFYHLTQATWRKVSYIEIYVELY